MAETLTAAIDELLDPRLGCSIHAVDHVLAGWGAEAHLERLERLITGLGLPLAGLKEALIGLESDPEAYLVSVEAHDRWRGDLPYEEYPMRRIASVHLFKGG